jgi:hypothetical protein
MLADMIKIRQAMIIIQQTAAVVVKKGFIVG